MTNADDFPAAFPGGSESASGALRWASGILAMTALGLALFNADAIAGWAEDLTMSAGTARIVTIADTWRSGTKRYGLDRPHASLHRLWKQAEAARWPIGQAPMSVAKGDDAP